MYELGYLLAPSLSPEELPAAYGNVKELVSSTSLSILSDEVPKMIPLAYTMQKVVANVPVKFSTAYFGWTKFEAEPSKVLELKKKLDLEGNVMRFLITKTVRENTIAAKRFVGRDSIRRRPPMARKDEKGEVLPINKEEIDKEIEALVAG